MGNSFFESTPLAPADSIFELSGLFSRDTRDDKVNLSIGVYRDESLKTPILKTVKQAEAFLLKEEDSKEYLGIEGSPFFIEESGKLVLGENLWKMLRLNIAAIQTPGGTGALRIGADVLKRYISNHISLPNPTWPNHIGVMKSCSFDIQSYDYYNSKKHELDFDAICSHLHRLSPSSIVLFHACCHNPSGADPSLEQWKELAALVKKKKLIPFFDFAYQGLGVGVSQDAFAIRHFAQEGIECFVASSFSKNFGLYSERVGLVFAIIADRFLAQNVLSQMKVSARTTYSNPPRHGASVVAHILSSEQLKQQWMQEVEQMRHRIVSLRTLLKEGLEKSCLDFSYLTKQHGMFCFLDLDHSKVEKLRKEYGIYMTSDGRINLAGLCSQNLNYVTKSILTVL